MPRVSTKPENPVEPLLESWHRSCDAYLALAAKSLESTLVSREFLEMSRHGLELLCGHRDRMAAAAAELMTIPARPAATRKTKKKSGRRER